MVGLLVSIYTNKDVSGLLDFDRIYVLLGQQEQ